jgi:amino acid transporter
MAKLKKFGTFGGVFTPSILTILGVIMYLRLPWIAGQAGLLVTIGIILLAHLISVTTGLSVSSIATDKKVKAGGTYYMISRSLGLPIGGTLGLALFVGLSFSVSLYLIGFAESFLSYWGFEVTKNSIRFAGTIILVSVTIVTFISTSLAIKTQYFIMTAIILSLLSVIFGQHSYTPTEPLINPIATAAPFIVLFGIFFPAVTGFEAGVSMSGDLQDPKKSIPAGTISAITIGLVAYIGLAFFFSYSVSSELLVNDPNALLKISILPELVIAGIWGATLSSAFGSILGAPRILQATSTDKITHKFFAKGFGPLNEPRNALLLTFLIAEAGILVGDLDVIARVVSMFFITTYGFLNLSCAIESWASSDFRPDFKIPKFVSIIGAAACFIVMIQLDFAAMVGATLILGSLFIYLTKKQLTLETGDTWDSVWSSVVRKGLAKLSRSKADIRNWRPNIILFSGGVSQERPHLLETGKWLTGRLGILSDFHLIEDKSAEALFKRESADENNSDVIEGIFTKNFVCRNIYEGIDAITRIYGFSGVEPNTVLMGWARNTTDPGQFARLIQNFNELDLNSLLIDYDKDRGFGKKRLIDVWWRGAGNNFGFELALVRFLTSTDDWRDAEIRFMVISQKSSIVNRAYKNLTQILDQYRINASIRIINNEIEKQKPSEIILAESINSDLVIFGIPEITKQNSESFINTINELTYNLGTVMLIRASSQFEEFNIGIQRDTDEAVTKIENEVLPDIKAKKNDVLEKDIQYYSSKVENIFNLFVADFTKDIFSPHLDLLNNYKDEIHKRYEQIEKKIQQYDGNEERKRILISARNDLIYHLTDEVDNVLNEQEKIKEYFSTSLSLVGARLNKLKEEVPDKIPVLYDPDDLQITKEDSIYERFSKRYRILRYSITKSKVKKQIKIGKFCSYYFDKLYADSFSRYLGECETFNYKILNDLQNSHASVLSSLDSIFRKINAKKDPSDLISAEKEKFDKLFDMHFEFAKSSLNTSSHTLFLSIRNYFQNLLTDLENISANSILRRSRKLTKTDKDQIQNTSEVITIWVNNSKRILNLIEADLLIEKFKGKILSNLNDIKLNVSRDLNTFYANKVTKLGSEIQNNIESDGQRQKNKFEIKFDESFELINLFEPSIEKIREDIIEFPDSIEIISEKSSENVVRQSFSESESLTINLRKIVDYNIESGLVENLYQLINQAQNELDKSVESIKSITGLLNFNLQNYDSPAVPDPASDPDTSITQKKSLQKVEQEVIKFTEMKANFLDGIDKIFQKSFEPLSSYRLIKSSLELRTQARVTSSKKFTSNFVKIKDSVNKFVKDQIVKLLYKKSEGLLFAQKIHKEEEKEVRISDVIAFTEMLTPNKNILNQIPFYYKKLFSGKATASKELWVGRAKEIGECNKAVQRFKQGSKGGLLILGERNQGKSSLSSFIAEKYFGTGNFFFLHPEPGGSVDLELFESKLQRTLNSDMNLEDTFARATKKSVLIINDLELWWQRSDDGFTVIDRISRLIESFGDKWFFILNANVHSYHFIKKIKPIDHYLLNIVNCEPYDAEDLKNMILLRHKASGMDFYLNGEEPSELKQARLFNAYFNYSNGNLWTALHGWVNSIKKVEANALHIDFPVIPEQSILELFPDKWILIIIQFALHRRLSLERLSRLMMNDFPDIDKIILRMKSAGVLTEYSKDVIEINPYVEPFIINHLVKSDIF